MSTNAVEKMLWQVSNNPAEADRLRADAQGYMKDFKLDADERALVDSWNVSALAERDVNPLLLMMAFTAVNGIQKMGEYVQRIHQVAGAA